MVRVAHKISTVTDPATAVPQVAASRPAVPPTPPAAGTSGGAAASARPLPLAHHQQLHVLLEQSHGWLRRRDLRRQAAPKQRDHRQKLASGQDYSCAATAKGDHVLQWVADLKGAGSDSRISGVTAADPMVADPADNGGPTFTMLPDAQSPVLAAGADCETFDQREQPRNTAVCDLGAVEIP